MPTVAGCVDTWTFLDRHSNDLFDTWPLVLSGRDLGSKPTGPFMRLLQLDLET